MHHIHTILRKNYPTSIENIKNTKIPYKNNVNSIKIYNELSNVKKLPKWYNALKSSTIVLKFTKHFILGLGILPFSHCGVKIGTQPGQDHDLHALT